MKQLARFSVNIDIAVDIVPAILLVTIRLNVDHIGILTTKRVVALILRCFAQQVIALLSIAVLLLVNPAGFPIG